MISAIKFKNMSTRANIILKDGSEQLFFYRHSDGYPEGCLPLLEKFLSWVKGGNLRDNLSQSAGWLILLGAIEYNSIPKFRTQETGFPGGKVYGNIESAEPPLNNGLDWKVGSIEPTTDIHGDIEWLYTIDLEKKTLEYHHV